MSYSVHISAIIDQEKLEAARIIHDICLDKGFDTPDEAVELLDHDGIDLCEVTTYNVQHESVTNTGDYLLINLSKLPVDATHIQIHASY